MLLASSAIDVTHRKCGSPARWPRKFEATGWAPPGRVEMLLAVGNSLRSPQMRVIVRPVVSSEPPADDGTMTSTLRCGDQPWARTAPALDTARINTAKHPAFFIRLLLADCRRPPGRPAISSLSC